MGTASSKCSPKETTHIETFASFEKIELYIPQRNEDLAGYSTHQIEELIFGVKNSNNTSALVIRGTSEWKLEIQQTQHYLRVTFNDTCIYDKQKNIDERGPLAPYTPMLQRLLIDKLKFNNLCTGFKYFAGHKLRLFSNIEAELFHFERYFETKMRMQFTLKDEQGNVQPFTVLDTTMQRGTISYTVWLGDAEVFTLQKTLVTTTGAKTNTTILKNQKHQIACTSRISRMKGLKTFSITVDETVLLHKMGPVISIRDHSKYLLCLEGAREFMRSLGFPKCMVNSYGWRYLMHKLRCSPTFTLFDDPNYNDDIYTLLQALENTLQDQLWLQIKRCKLRDIFITVAK